MGSNAIATVYYFKEHLLFNEIHSHLVLFTNILLYLRLSVNFNSILFICSNRQHCLIQTFIYANSNAVSSAYATFSEERMKSIHIVKHTMKETYPYF